MEIEGKNGREVLDDRNYKLKQDKNTSAGAELSRVVAGCGIKKPMLDTRRDAQIIRLKEHYLGLENNMI